MSASSELMRAVKALDQVQDRCPEECLAAVFLIAIKKLPAPDNTQWYGDPAKDDALETLYKIGNLYYEPICTAAMVAVSTKQNG